MQAALNENDSAVWDKITTSLSLFIDNSIVVGIIVAAVHAGIATVVMWH